MVGEAGRAIIVVSPNRPIPSPAEAHDRAQPTPSPGGRPPAAAADPATAIPDPAVQPSPTPPLIAPRPAGRRAAWHHTIWPPPTPVRSQSPVVRGAAATTAPAAGRGPHHHLRNLRSAARQTPGSWPAIAAASPRRPASTSPSCGSVSFSSAWPAASPSSSTRWPGSSSLWRASRPTSSREPSPTAAASALSSPSSRSSSSRRSSSPRSTSVSSESSAGPSSWPSA